MTGRIAVTLFPSGKASSGGILVMSSDDIGSKDLQKMTLAAVGGLRGMKENS